MLFRACETLWSAREIASVALSAEREGHTENMFHRACETLWSAREIVSVALSAERERHTKNGVWVKSIFLVHFREVKYLKNIL